jgi:hypothetical protein
MLGLCQKLFQPRDGRRHGRAAPRIIDDIESDAWKRACAQASDLKSVLGNREFTQAQAKELACRWSTSVRTVWRRVRAFRRESSVRAFLQNPRGSVPGTGRLKDAVESLIVDIARTWWKVSESATIAEIYPDVMRECAGRGLARPSRATVARRLAALRSDPANFSWHGDEARAQSCAQCVVGVYGDRRTWPSYYGCSSARLRSI